MPLQDNAIAVHGLIPGDALNAPAKHTPAASDPDNQYVPRTTLI